MKKVFFFAFMSLLTMRIAAQQTVWLKNGRSYQGEIVAVIDTALLLNESGSSVQHVLSLNDIKCLRAHDENLRDPESLLRYFVSAGLLNRDSISGEYLSTLASVKKPTTIEPMSDIALAGEDLIKASKTYYWGMFLLLSGSVMLGFGGTFINPALIFTGSMFMLAGTITQIVSHSYIGKAGKKLKYATLKGSL